MLSPLLLSLFLLLSLMRRRGYGRLLLRSRRLSVRTHGPVARRLPWSTARRRRTRGHRSAVLMGSPAAIHQLATEIMLASSKSRGDGTNGGSSVVVGLGPMPSMPSATSPLPTRFGLTTPGGRHGRV